MENEWLGHVSRIQGDLKGEPPLMSLEASAGPAHFTAHNFVHLSWIIMKMNSFRKWLSLSLHGRITKVHPRSSVLNKPLKMTTLWELRVSYLPKKFAFEHNQNIFWTKVGIASSFLDYTLLYFPFAIFKGSQDLLNHRLESVWFVPFPAFPTPRKYERLSCSIANIYSGHLWQMYSQFCSTK